MARLFRISDSVSLENSSNRRFPVSQIFWLGLTPKNAGALARLLHPPMPESRSSAAPVLGAARRARQLQIDLLHAQSQVLELEQQRLQRS